jgi:hypothetical protein
MRLVLAFGIALIIAALAAPTALHAGATPHMIFAAVDIGHSQTARLNLSNIANTSTISNPDLLPAGPCHVVMGFVDGSNQMLVPAVRVALAGGQSTHVEVSVGNPDPRKPGFFRKGGLQARAVVGFSPDAPGACDAIVGSVQIADSDTGATTTIVNPIVYVGFNPQPDIPGFGALTESGQ